jgi:hypothetical protein
MELPVVGQGVTAPKAMTPPQGSGPHKSQLTTQHFLHWRFREEEGRLQRATWTENRRAAGRGRPDRAGEKKAVSSEQVHERNRAKICNFSRPREGRAKNPSVADLQVRCES